MLFKGLLLSIFFEYVRPGNYIPVFNMLKVGTILPLAVFAACLVQQQPVSNEKVYQHINTKWLLFYFVLLFLSVLMSDVTLFSYAILTAVTGYLIWYFIIVKLVTDLGKIKLTLATLVFSHVLLVFLNPHIVLEPETRNYIQAAPFLGDGNDFSLSICIVWPMCLFLYLEAKTFLLRITYLGSLLVLMFAVIGTQSRGAAVSFICLFLFLMWKGRQKLLGLLVLCVVGLIVASYAPDVYFDRLSTVINYEKDGSAMGRIVAWKAAVRMVTAHPLTGVGSGHFSVKLGTEFRPPEFGDEHFPWLTAHSLYFLILAELGLPGIVFLLFLLAGTYLRVNRLYICARGSPDAASKSYARLFLMLNASLIAFAVGGAFLSVAYYPHIFVLTGLIVAATYIYEDKTNKVNKLANMQGDSDQFVKARTIGTKQSPAN